MRDHRHIDNPLSLTETLDPAAERPMLTGTSVAVARAAGVSTLVVRIAFVLLSLSAGLGVVLYGIAWLGMGHGRRMVEPSPAADTGLAQDPARNLGFGLLVLAVVVSTINAGFAPRVIWPAVIVAVGVAVAWREGAGVGLPGVNATGRATDPGPDTDRAIGRSLLRQVAGMALVLLGVGVLLFSNFTFAALLDGIVAGVIVTIGVALVLGPWMLRATRTALGERRERVRSEERAAMAAHLHDSVLQTLTLIQKRSASASDPDARAISALARRQERELRGWLYGVEADSTEGTFRSAMAKAVADVEDLHAVTIEAVTVGDAPLDPSLEAVIGAVREALVNAAKFSGRTDVSLFVELTASSVSAFVRDRGVGFDPSVLPEDRHGITDSIIGRIERHGGQAVVHSQPGEGTEVEISMPRQQAERDGEVPR